MAATRWTDGKTATAWRTAWAVALALTAWLATALAANPPFVLSAQGRLLAQGAGAAPDGKYGLVFSLYPNQKASESLWQEAMVGINVAGGMFSTQLGANAKNPLTVPLFADNAELWLGVGIDGDPELSRVRLWSVPYAVTAAQAGHALTADALAKPLTGQQIADGTVTAEKLANGAVTGSKVAFLYAASDDKGGSALSAEYAKKLQCTGCVTDKMLADKAVTAAAIADKAVGSGQVADKAIGTAQLAGAAVTAAQLAKDAVITVHVQDKAITAPKIGSFAFPITDGPAFPCDAAHLGWAFIDKKDTVLYVCNGKDLHALSALVQVGTVSSPGASCADILKKSTGTKSGAYWIDPDGPGGSKAFEVYCDMVTDGGGWTLVGKTAGLAHNNDNGQLDGHDATRWNNKQYLGDTTNLVTETALGKAYESVPFRDFLLVGMNDASKKLAWRMDETFTSLHAVFTSSVTKQTTMLLVGNFKTLDWRPGCGTGNGPDGTGPQFYGFNIRSDADVTNPGLFNGFKSGWCSALAGWGRNNGNVDYTGGGLGADCQGRSHQMGRHYWGYGDGCDGAGWSGQSNLNSFYGHAFFVR